MSILSLAGIISLVFAGTVLVLSPCFSSGAVKHSHLCIAKSHSAGWFRRDAINTTFPFASKQLGVVGSNCYFNRGSFQESFAGDPVTLIGQEAER